MPAQPAAPSAFAAAPSAYECFACHCATPAVEGAGLLQACPGCGSSMGRMVDAATFNKKRAAGAYFSVKDRHSFRLPKINWRPWAN